MSSAHGIANPQYLAPYHHSHLAKYTIQNERRGNSFIPLTSLLTHLDDQVEVAERLHHFHVHEKPYYIAVVHLESPPRIMIKDAEKYLHSTPSHWNLYELLPGATQFFYIHSSLHGLFHQILRAKTVFDDLDIACSWQRVNESKRADFWINRALKNVKDHRNCFNCASGFEAGDHAAAIVAVKIYTKLAEFEYPEVHFRLANYFLERKTIRNLSKALSFLESASEKNYLPATLKLAKIFDPGDSTGRDFAELEKDREKSKRFYQKVVTLSEGGHMEAAERLRHLSIADSVLRMKSASTQTEDGFQAEAKRDRGKGKKSGCILM